MFKGLGALNGESDVVELLALLAAILLVLVVILLSAYFRLGLHKTTVIATVRLGSISFPCPHVKLSSTLSR